MANALTSALVDIDSKLRRIRLDIAHADVAVLTASADVRDRSATTRALVYVWLAAALERFVRDALQFLLLELNALCLPHAGIRTSVFSLVADDLVERVRVRKRRGAWLQRIEMFDIVQSSQQAVFSPDVLPLDGRTLRPEHFENIWLVFGFAGSSLPSRLHAPALNDLAEGRNLVAHGNVDPISFGKTKATADLVRLSQRVEDVATHLTMAIEAYLASGGFKR